MDNSSHLNISLLRKHAKRRLPKMFWAYLEGGGYEEETIFRNRRDIEALALHPRVLKDVSERSIETRLLGTGAAMPLALDPVGGCGIFSRNGEISAAKAAERFGVPFCLSTLSICTIEDVAAELIRPHWFQLYLFKDRKLGESLIRRAADAGCSALVMSMDVHVRSSRYDEAQHGLTAPPKVNFQTVFDVLTHPRWFLPMLASKRRTFGNLGTEIPECGNVFGATKWLEDQWDPTLGPNEIEWVRKRWPGKFILKGIMHPEDAKLAVSLGAEAIVISNHGGRQVDGAVSTASVLPSIVDAVAGRAEVYVDSGIRTGADILKLLGLGANACMIGRAYCYGLAAGGEDGVFKVLEILRRELDETAALCGITDIHHLPSDLVTLEREPLGNSPNRAFLS